MPMNQQTANAAIGVGAMGLNFAMSGSYLRHVMIAIPTDHKSLPPSSPYLKTGGGRDGRGIPIGKADAYLLPEATTLRSKYRSGVPLRRCPEQPLPCVMKRQCVHLSAPKQANHLQNSWHTLASYQSVETDEHWPPGRARRCGHCDPRPHRFSEIFCFRRSEDLLAALNQAPNAVSLTSFCRLQSDFRSAPQSTKPSFGEIEAPTLPASIMMSPIALPENERRPGRLNVATFAGRQ